MGGDLGGAAFDQHPDRCRGTAQRCATARAVWLFRGSPPRTRWWRSCRSLPGLFEQLDDPIWRRADGLLGLNALPRISSRAEIPPEAIGHFLLLVTSFVSGFLVATSRRNGDMLVQFARYSILAYAAYGIAALVLTPNLLLWAPKLAYRGSLTATFVNHNTAATFLGAGAILWFCLACLSLQSLRYSSIRLLLLVPSNERVVFTIILHSVAGLVCFVALLLTGSRGGLICTALGLLVAIVLMVTNRLRPRLWYVAAFRKRGAGVDRGMAQPDRPDREQGTVR